MIYGPCDLTNLLALICDLDLLFSEEHTRQAFLGCYRALFGFVFHKRYPAAAWHKPNFPETIKATECCRKCFNAHFLPKILQEQNLVGRKILIRYGCRARWASRLETRRF